MEAEKIRPLNLAYVGDTILDLYVRSLLVSLTHLHPKELHKKASSIVNAHSQAQMVKILMDELTEEEKDVFRTARNQHPGTVPKNQSPVDYKWATGYEALMGYLYLKGETKRLAYLLEKSVRGLEEEENKKENQE